MGGRSDSSPCCTFARKKCSMLAHHVSDTLACYFVHRKELFTQISPSATANMPQTPPENPVGWQNPKQQSMNYEVNQEPKNDNNPLTITAITIAATITAKNNKNP